MNYRIYMDNLEKQLENLKTKNPTLKEEWRMGFKFLKTWFGIRGGKEKTTFNYKIIMRPAFAVVMLLLLIWLPYFAYASPSVYDGHWLWPVKQVIENIELKTAGNDEKKAEKLEKFAAKRVGEAEELLADKKAVGKVKKEKIIKSVVEATALHEQAAELLDTASKDKLVPDGEEKKLETALEDLAGQVGVEDEELTETVALAIESVKESRGDFKERVKERQLGNKEERVREAAATTTSPRVPAWVGEKNQEASSAPPWIKTDKKQDKAIFLEKNLESLKTVVEKLKENVDEEYEDEKLEKFTGQLDKKIKKAAGAIWENPNKAEELMKSAEALMNNTKHFVKPKNDYKNKWKKKEQEKPEDEEKDDDKKIKENRWENLRWNRRERENLTN